MGMNVGDFLDGLSLTEWGTLHASVPAVPATLQFAKFLSWNCSCDAGTYLRNVSEYTSTSSNQLDAFASDIQNFVAKVQSFDSPVDDFCPSPLLALSQRSRLRGLLWAEDPFLGWPARPGVGSAGDRWAFFCF